MKQDSRLRAVAKNIPPLYWLVGLAQYVRFRGELRHEDHVYRENPSSKSPPPILRYRVHRAFDEASYLANGKVIAKCLADAFSEADVRLENLKILDFACGPGRVINAFRDYTDSCSMYGSDIDVQAIEWAQTHLSDVARFSTNAATAPTSFDSGMFDAIYCVSLFTHLDESAQDDWLAELARLLKPGGVFVTTTHGRLATSTCTQAELAALQTNGICFRVDRRGRFKVDGLPDFYQTTFHAANYVKTHWGRILPVVSYIEGGIAGHQDVVVMRKPVEKRMPRSGGLSAA